MTDLRAPDLADHSVDLALRYRLAILPDFPDPWPLLGVSKV